jgi:hypothetical protein
MIPNQDKFEGTTHPISAMAFLRHAMDGAVTTIRVLIAALLLFFQPIIGFMLCASAIILAIVSVFLKLTRAVPKFPVWGMLGLSSGLYLLFMMYTAVLLLAAPRPDH